MKADHGVPKLHAELETALTRRHVSACMIAVALLERTDNLKQITFFGTPNCRAGGATLNKGNSQPS